MPVTIPENSNIFSAQRSNIAFEIYAYDELD